MAKTVVFDLGMVLASPVGLYERVAELLHTTPAAVQAGMWGPHRVSYDEGGSDRDYWSATLPHIVDVPVDDFEALLPALVAADVEGWRHIRPEARSIVADLVDAGVPRNVLSNAPNCLADAAPAFDWFSLIDRFFFSAQLGMVKPNPEIYASVEDALGVPASELLFIDDKQPNVQAARARGWTAHLWVDDADTRRWLVTEGVLPE